MNNLHIDTLLKTMPIDKDSNNLNVRALKQTISASLTKESLLFKSYGM